MFVDARRRVAEISLQVFEGGRGEPLLWLHDQECLNAPEDQPFARRLAERYWVVLPSHPGFGESELPEAIDSVQDLAYVYLDFLRDRFGSTPVHVVGAGLGGWVAAEVAVRCGHGLRSLTLVDALGIKVGDRTARDIADTFVVGPEEILRLSWHDLEAGRAAMPLPGIGEHTLERLTTLLRNRQTAALIGWKPFMHNPKLLRRLRRIDVPTLVVWGASDRIVSPDYGRAFADAIPGARFLEIPEAGHYPYLERPDAFVETVCGFLSSAAGAAEPALAGGGR